MGVHLFLVVETFGIGLLGWNLLFGLTAAVARLGAMRMRSMGRLRRRLGRAARLLLMQLTLFDFR